LAAIRCKQVSADLSVCVLEKGSEVGALILSDAVVDPRALDELLPDWREDGDCPLKVPVTENHHWILARRRCGEPSFIDARQEGAREEAPQR
jgi:electron-transferring-flavoprotein dehydrogenase